jgi:Co/Zn/Cd efflux system component
MSHHHPDHHPSHDSTTAIDPRYQRILWIALVLNAAMFFVEMWGSRATESNALLADAIDFLGDAMNYGVSIWALAGTLALRARTALLKGICMALFGLFVIGRAVWMAYLGTVPEPYGMGLIGALALTANVGVALLLYAYRHGDANRRSVWLCTRNDAIGNLAVIAAAVAVALTASRWPDVMVSFGMGCLALQSAWLVLWQAKHELAIGKT